MAISALEERNFAAKKTRGRRAEGRRGQKEYSTIGDYEAHTVPNKNRFRDSGELGKTETLLVVPGDYWKMSLESLSV